MSSTASFMDFETAMTPSAFSYAVFSIQPLARYPEPNCSTFQGRWGSKE